MRLHFNLSSNTEVVPFDYQHFLIGTFHKWMEWNDLHDEISLYSLSWIQGGIKVKDGFNFPKGAKWFISFWDDDIGKKIMKNAMKDPETFCGMSVREIQIQETPEFGAKEIFKVSSPVFIRKYDENRKAIHLTYKEDETDQFLTETLKKKMLSANLDYEIKVGFDRKFGNAKTKVVNINGISSKANMCPVILEGDPEAIKFAWNVGIGHSTGCGFGSLF